MNSNGHDDHFIQEGFIPFRGYRTWYRTIGNVADTSDGQLPMLLVHGTPVSHQSLEPLERLAETGRPIILYDQLGCGKSDQPQGLTWDMTLFADQLAVVRQALGLDHIHLLGHSFGGQVVGDYVLSEPTGIASLTLHSSAASNTQVISEVNRIRAALPEHVKETLRKHEADGSTDEPAYHAANRVFDFQHICRIDPWPDFLMRSLEKPSIANLEIKSWDIRPQLGEITIPTLITSGRYDISTPSINSVFEENIPNSKWVLFEKSSHYAHAEEPERFLSVLNEFLSSVEKYRC
jgi:proline-specific peptidase